MGNELSSSGRRGDNDTVMSEDDRKRSKSRSRKNESSATLLIDTICGTRGSFYYDDEDTPRYHRRRGYSHDDDSYESDDDGTYASSLLSGENRRKKSKSKMKTDSDSLISNDDESRNDRRNPKSSSKSSKKNKEGSYNEDDPSVVGTNTIEVEHQNKTSSITANINENTSFTSNSPDNSPAAVPHSSSKTSSMMSRPLASSFAKRCYFTKAGIGKTTQHYEGLTLTGNTVLMLASSMKLKGCPTICDEDLRRVEASFPNQFSRLPDELMLSSGWKRISKYCHFSNKPIADGTPFFHSRERVHPNTGGYYFLLASAVGMTRAQDVEPLTLDLLILLQTDYPNQCDAAPASLVEDPSQWTLVNKFCFFSGGPINTEEDVYYEADFDGNPIYMLAFLSPSLTPEELYRLNDITGENAIKNVEGVEEVERVYDLTERDFDDLRLYHLGPCRALPNYILSPGAWTKVLPRHFVECREKALARAYEYEVHAQEAVAAATGGKFPIGPTDSGSVAQTVDSGVGIGTQGSGYEEFGRQQQQDYGYGDNDNGEIPSPLHSHEYKDPANGYHFQSSEEDQFGHHAGPSKSQSFSPTRTQQYQQPSQHPHSNYDNEEYPNYDPNFSNYSNPDTVGSEQSGSAIESPQKMGSYEHEQNLHRAVYEEGAIISSNEQPMDEAMASKVARELDFNDQSYVQDDNRPDPSGVVEVSPERSRLDPPMDDEYYDEPDDPNFSISSPNRADPQPADFSITTPIRDSFYPDDQRSDGASQVSATDKQSNIGSTYTNYDEPTTPKSLITSAQEDSPANRSRPDRSSPHSQSRSPSRSPSPPKQTQPQVGYSSRSPSRSPSRSLSPSVTKGYESRSPSRSPSPSKRPQGFDRSPSGSLSPSKRLQAFNRSPRLSPSKRSTGPVGSPAALSTKSRSSNGDSPHTPMSDHPFSENQRTPSPSKPSVVNDDNIDDEVNIRGFDKGDEELPFDANNDEKNRRSGQKEVVQIDIPPPPDDDADDNNAPSPSLRLPSSSPQSRGRKSPKVDSDDITVASEYSKSSAMRGAQELLKKNRQRRLEIMARRRQQQSKKNNQSVENEDNSSFTNDENSIPSRSLPVSSPSSGKGNKLDSRNAESQKLSSKLDKSTRKANGDYDALSGVSNPSSILTDETSPGEKNARRALILQMAKNRMKKGKDGPGSSFKKQKDSMKENTESESVIGSVTGSHVSNGSLD